MFNWKYLKVDNKYKMLVVYFILLLYVFFICFVSMNDFQSDFNSCPIAHCQVIINRQISFW